MFDSVDIKEQLEKAQSLIFKDADAFLDEFKEILASEAEKDEAVIEEIRKSRGELPTKIDIDKIDTSRIYNLAAIKKICVNYRLKFLDSYLYKGELPYETVQKVRQFEELHNTKVESFKIIAPKEFFALEDRYADPLLFASLGNGYYYLIAKWGNDLSWKRKLTAFPRRNIITALATIYFFCALFTFCLPVSLFHFYAIQDADIFRYRIYLSLHLLIFFSMITVYACYAFHLYPSNVDWNNKHFN